MDRRQVGDRVEPELQVVEGDPALAVARRAAHVGHQHVEARERERLPDGREHLRRLGLRSAVDVQHRRPREHGVRLVVRWRGREAEARHLLAVGRRDAVHGGRHEPVAQVGRQRGTPVDQLRHRAGAGVDAEDRARVGRRHRRQHEARAVGRPAHADGDDRPEVDVDPVGAVGLVDRERVGAVDVVEDQDGRPVARDDGTEVVVGVLDQHPPAAVEAEVPDRVELAVVVGGHHQAVVAGGPARDRVVGVLVGGGQRARLAVGRRARRSCRAEPGSVW